jgi:hypothetical protein
MTPNTDQLRQEITEDGQIILEPEYIAFLRSNGYPINEVVEIREAKSESRDMTHLIYTVKTTELPQDHPELDIVAHETEIKVCTCEDFRFNQSVDVGKRHLADESVGSCKHIRGEFRAEKAQEDENQMELGE